jgi:hypothetical protein
VFSLSVPESPTLFCDDILMLRNLILSIFVNFSYVLHFQSPPKNAPAPSTAGRITLGRGRGRAGKNPPKMMKTNLQAGSSEVPEVQSVSLTLTLS